LLYVSDQKLTSSDFEKPDVSVDFFRYSDPVGWSQRLPMLPEVRAPDGRALRLQPFERNRRTDDEAALGRESYELAESTARIPFDLRSPRPEPFGLSDDGSWRLAIRWREGSMAEAIRRMRQRNMAVSFGILLLLGISMALVVLSSRRARSLASQKLKFVSGITHDFRTPLSVICAGAENLAQGVTKGQGETTKYGRIILDEGRKLTGMVEQALRFSGIRLTRKALELRRCEMGELVGKALEGCRQLIHERNIAVEKEIPAEGYIVFADRQAMQAAVQNLIANAAKYSKTGGRIDITVAKRSAAKGVMVIVSVRDYGLGIPDADKRHIFEPFYRGTNVRGSKISASGLGLAFVKEVANLHGGQVGFTSEIGAGSTFFIKLSEARHGKYGTDERGKGID
jgi:signal transduction histidine kinase